MSVGSGDERRITVLREQSMKLRERIGILDEQIAYVEDVADAARMRALVASTPLAARERHDAEEDVRRARVQRDETADRLAEVLAEQDRLLERLHVGSEVPQR